MTQQPTLGEFLRQERERRGITIEQVASATKISVRLLHLLESDQFAELPAKPFIRGFVNSYCRFIGMDSKEVLIRFGAFLEERSHERPTRDEGHSGYAFERREGEQSRTILSIVMAAFVVLGGLAFAILKPSLHHHHGSHADKLREANASPSAEVSSPSPGVSVALIPAPTSVPSVLVFSPSPSPPAASPIESASIMVPERTPTQKATTEVPEFLRPPKRELKAIETVPSPAPTKSPKAKPTPSATPMASPEPSGKPDPLNSGVNLKGSEIKYKVVLKTAADTWVRYEDDDRPRMKFILRAGKVLVLRAQREIKFQASQPEAISFRINSGPERHLVGDANVAVRGKDLTLFIPKELIETIQEPFPGERTLQGAFIPIGRGSNPAPAPTH